MARSFFLGIGLLVGLLGCNSGSHMDPGPAPVPSAPQIVAQPTAQSVAEGSSVHFQVGVTGSAPMTFTWFKNTTQVQRSSLPTYDLGTVSLADAGSYHVEVSNALGTAVSAAAALAVSPAPVGNKIRLSFTNGTKGVWPDDQVYLTLTGVDPVSGNLGYIDRTGKLNICRDPEDNTLTCPRDVTNSKWANYAMKLSEVPYIELDPARRISGGRIYISLGDRLWVRAINTVSDTGVKGVGLVQPNLGNDSDPNQAIFFDWVEFALADNGFFVNTTCVDQFGFPVTVELTNQAGSIVGKVGITESRTALFAAYKSFVADQAAGFATLVDSDNHRILSPSQGAAFQANGTEKDYLASYIQAMWTLYKTNDLVLNCNGGPFTGRVDASNTFTFTTPAATGSFLIKGLPSTQEVLKCNGILDKAKKDQSNEGVVRAQVAALLNRHIMATPGDWTKDTAYYQAAPCNYYAAFWHKHSLGEKAYAFPFDDVADKSPSLQATQPKEVRIGFSWD